MCIKESCILLINFSSKLPMKLKNSEKNPRKMHFAAIFRPKFQNFFFRCLPWGNNLDPLNYAHSKETESLGKYGCR